MTLLVELPDGTQDSYEAGFVHAMCGQVITSREHCPYCGGRPLIESTERVSERASEEPDGTLIVYRGTWVANAYPPWTWVSYRTV